MVEAGPVARPAIRALAPEVAARIAAGEVIERPASIVKELVENALDAGASVIDVEISDGGVELLRVRDNGFGMRPDELADAFERHSTSKLRTAGELFEIETLGFRGEALAALVAAADVTCTTRQSGEQAAAVIRFRDGRAAGQGSAAAAPGTTVEVRDLFASLPARRRFLRSPRAEARAVTRTVGDYALAYPDVAFRLRSDGRETLRTPGSGSAREALGAVYGAEAARNVLEVGASDAAAGVRVDVSGLAGPPGLHRANRQGIHLYANGRAIQSRTLTHAVEQAYSGVIPAGRHPLAVLHIRVPPSHIDVNVHPRKAEVRFRDERLVFTALRKAIVEALSGAPVSSVIPPLPAAPGSPWAPAADAATGDARGDAPGHAAGGSGRLVRGLFSGVTAAVRSAAEREADPLGAAAGDQPPLPMRERLPALRPLGQFGDMFLVAEAPDGLYLIDQHAAHERVLYERALDAVTRARPDVQPLLEPIVVTLTAAQAALAAAEAEAIDALGFELDEADGAALIIRAVPAMLAGSDPANALTEYLDRLDAEERLTGPDRAAASLACRGAVMAGDRLDDAQQRELLRALEGCRSPQTCPHGRPTMLHFSREALERSFGRR